MPRESLSRLWLPALSALLVALVLHSAARTSIAQDTPELLQLNEKFLALYNSARYREAEPLARRILEIEKDVAPGIPFRIARAQYNLAEVLVFLERLDEAEKYSKHALENFERAVGQQNGAYAYALNNLGNIRYAQSRYAEAEELFKKSLAVREDLWGPLHADVAASLNNLANVDHATGKYDQAERHIKRAIHILEKVEGPDDPVLAKSINNLAMIYHEERRDLETEQLHLRALRIRESKLGRDHVDVSQSLMNLGAVYCDLGRYAEAETALTRALQILRHAYTAPHPDLARCLNNLALVNDEQHRFVEAEQLYRQALKISETTLGEDNVLVALCTKNLASVCSDLGRYDDAERLHQKSLQIRERRLGPSHPDVASSLNDLANVYFRQGKYEAVDALDRRALAIRESVLGPQHPDLALSLRNMAVLQRDRGHLDKALELIDRAISIVDRGTNIDDRFGCYYIRARLNWQLAHRDQALSDLRNSLDLAEAQRVGLSGLEHERARVFAGFGNAFEQMVAWQREMGHIGEAFAAAERFRGRTLQDQMAVAGVDLLSGLPDVQAAPLRQTERRAGVKIAELEKKMELLTRQTNLSNEERSRKREQSESELQQAQVELIEAFRAIRNSSPALRLAGAEDQEPIPLDRLQKWVAQNNALLIEYLLGETQGFVFIVPPEGEPQLVPLTVDADHSARLGIAAGPLTLKQIAAALANDQKTGVLDLLHDPEHAEEAVPKLAALWEVLVPESERKLITDATGDAAKVKRLIVIPDGPLALLPFETLVVEQNQTPKYLLDAGPPILYGPSATVLYNLAQLAPARASNREPILTVGDPAYVTSVAKPAATTSALAELAPRSRFTTVGGHLSRLPYSGLESQWVASVFQRDGSLASKRLSGAEATEAGVRNEIVGRRYVHLACHGQADQKYGNFFGALALAPGKSAANPADDGFLTLPEIYELDLTGCELSILSACQTNFGPQQKGEGVWALSRGFLVAGSKRVVASNWLVDDKAAASLISHFCSGIAKSEKTGTAPDYADRLHKAKKWIREQEEWQSPYYWGTFVLLGPQ